MRSLLWMLRIVFYGLFLGRFSLSKLHASALTSVLGVHLLAYKPFPTRS